MSSGSLDTDDGRIVECMEGLIVRLAIMQPYFFPYIGYFQLIQCVDRFIVYDNIKYTKKGWINRNRLLQNGQDAMFSLPLKSDSDFLDVRDRSLAHDFKAEKLIAQICGAYRRAPYLAQTLPLVEEIVRYPEPNLFRFLHHSIVRTCEHLGITTRIEISSDFPIDHQLKSQDKVLALCEAAGASTYINTSGGMDLYSRDDFASRNIELQFIRPKPFDYPQFGHAFVPWLSIIDVLMFNPMASVRQCISTHFELT